ncbi:MAG: FkbM family methyltransferase [Actinobacteria bacterium]|nr:FkbM family methyltransferase [Actinomycetota bacterium]
MTAEVQTPSGTRRTLPFERQRRSLRGLVTRAGYAVLPRLGFEVTSMGPGAVLVARPVGGGRRWMKLEKEFFEYLSGVQIGGLLQMYRVNCVIDVGAHRGQYAERLREAGYRGQIVSFEPVRHAFERLQRASAHDPGWEVHQLALGREDGEIAMNVVPGTLSSLLPATEFGAGRYPRLQEAEQVTVQVRRLDALLDDLVARLPEPRVYLKLDTQGYDLDVFSGLGDRAAELVGMQSEVALMRIYEGSPRMCESLEVYEAAGFEVAGLYPLSRQSRTARVLEYDCVMVRASALRRSAGTAP